MSGNPTAGMRGEYRPTSPLLAKRAEGEVPLIQGVVNNTSRRLAGAPKLLQLPVGEAALESLSREEVPAS